MSRQMMTIADAARLLTESAAMAGSDEEFAQLAEELLEENSPGEIAAIAAHMPEALRPLMPRRTLH